MQLRRDESGLLSHNGKLLPKSGQEFFHVLMLHQEGAEEDYRRNVVYDLLVKARWTKMQHGGHMQGTETNGIEERLDDETSGSAGFSGINKEGLTCTSEINLCFLILSCLIFQSNVERAIPSFAAAPSN
jgi:hypothetical protein